MPFKQQRGKIILFGERIESMTELKSQLIIKTGHFRVPRDCITVRLLESGNLEENQLVMLIVPLLE